MKTVLKEEIVSLIDIGGTKYLRVDPNRLKSHADNIKGQDYDAKKHSVRLRTGQNSKGQVYSEFWFVEKP